MLIKIRDQMETIAFTPEQVPVIEDILCMSKIHVYVNHKRITGLFCGFAKEECYHAVYPILLEMPNRNFEDCRRKRYIAGCPSPHHVFGVLAEAFKQLWPNLPAEDIQRWELFKYSRALYGKPMVDAAISHDNLSTQIRFCREFGGKKSMKCVLWSTEHRIKRYTCSIPVRDLVGPGEEALPETYLPDQYEAMKKLGEMISPDDEAIRRALLESEEATDNNKEVECCIMQE